MQILREQIRAAVREEYRILLCAEGRTELPEGSEKICAYYRKTAEACVKWAVEVEGERVRAEYLALEDHMERARFRTVCYRLECRLVWEGNGHAAWVCGSEYRTEEERRCCKSAQVWNLAEQTMLPPAQILKLVGYRPGRGMRPPFRTEGCYPEGEDLVFFSGCEPDGARKEFRVRLKKEENSEMKKR